MKILERISNIENRLYSLETIFGNLKRSKSLIKSEDDKKVKEGFRWLQKESDYIDNISSASIKLNENGIILLKSLNKI